jgi:hypothetical protein
MADFKSMNNRVAFLAGFSFALDGIREGKPFKFIEAEYAVLEITLGVTAEHVAEYRKLAVEELEEIELGLWNGMAGLDDVLARLRAARRS